MLGDEAAADEGGRELDAGGRESQVAHQRVNEARDPRRRR